MPLCRRMPTYSSSNPSAWWFCMEVPHTLRQQAQHTMVMRQHKRAGRQDEDATAETANEVPQPRLTMAQLSAGNVIRDLAGILGFCAARALPQP